MLQSHQSLSWKIIKFVGELSQLSRSQRAITLHSCESEYISRTACVQGVLFLGQVFGFVSMRNQGREGTVSEDREGIVQSANYPRAAQSSASVGPTCQLRRLPHRPRSPRPSIATSDCILVIVGRGRKTPTRVDFAVIFRVRQCNAVWLGDRPLEDTFHSRYSTTYRSAHSHVGGSSSMMPVTNRSTLPLRSV